MLKRRGAISTPGRLSYDRTKAGGSMMKYSIPSILALLLLLFLPTSALADPPLGTWVGDHGSITFTLSPDGTYVMPPSTSGNWAWQQTSPNGGILTLFYDTVTVTQTFHNKMYFSIEFADASTATLTEPIQHMSDTIRKQ